MSLFTLHTYLGADGQLLRYGQLTTQEPVTLERPLLFIPGLGGSVKNRLPFLKQLLNTFHPIYGLDLRGFGLNAHPQPLTSVEHFLPDLKAAYQHILHTHGGAPPVLGGISLGAVLAVLLEQQLSGLSGLLLLAPAFKPNPQTFSKSYRWKRTLSYFLGKFCLQGPPSIELPYQLSDLTQNPAVLNDPHYQGGAPFKLSSAFLMDAKTLCQQARFSSRHVRTPTFLAIPGQDRVCDPGAMASAFQAMAPHPLSVQETFPGFYHDIMLEQESLQVVQAIQRWAKELS